MDQFYKVWQTAGHNIRPYLKNNKNKKHPLRAVSYTVYSMYVQLIVRLRAIVTCMVVQLSHI